MERTRTARRSLVLGIALGLATSACSSDGTGSTPATDAPAAPSASLPGSFGDVSSAACQANRATLDVAVEAWFALHGDAVAPTEADLVAEGLIRADVPGFGIDASGAVVPEAGASCA